MKRDTSKINNFTFVDSSIAPHFPLIVGYTEPREPTEEEFQLFSTLYQTNDTTSKEEREDWPTLTPELVATQVVAGINYAFYCKDENGKCYTVIIYRPLQGDASITSVSHD